MSKLLIMINRLFTAHDILKGQKHANDVLDRHMIIIIDSRLRSQRIKYHTMYIMAHKTKASSNNASRIIRNKIRYKYKRV